MASSEVIADIFRIIRECATLPAPVVLRILKEAEYSDEEINSTLAYLMERID